MSRVSLMYSTIAGQMATQARAYALIEAEDAGHPDTGKRKKKQTLPPSGRYVGGVRYVSVHGTYVRLDFRKTERRVAIKGVQYSNNSARRRARKMFRKMANIIQLREKLGMER